LAARGLYGVGDPVFRYDRRSGRNQWSEFEVKKELTRKGKGTIPLDTFLDPLYAPVSAVWVMSLDEFDLLHDDPVVLPRERCASAILHNPHANVMLGSGLLPAYEEWTITSGDDMDYVTRILDAYYQRF
jgi:hypothetical protein